MSVSDPTSERSKRRSGRRWAFAATLVVAGVVAAVLAQWQLSTPVSVEGPTAREDDVEFTVLSASCDAVSLSAVSGTTAHPEKDVFCVVRLDVMNWSEDPVSLEAGCQYMIDRSGARHTPREDISALSEVSRGLFDEGIEGFQIAPSVSLYYDVQEGTEAAAVELHSTCNSRGLNVPVPPGPHG